MVSLNMIDTQGGGITRMFQTQRRRFFSLPDYDPLQPELVAVRVAAATGGKAQHICNRGFDNRYYRDLIVDLVREHQPVSRLDIDTLLMAKLPELLTEEQKLNRIHNLLRQLADAGQIGAW